MKPTKVYLALVAAIDRRIRSLRWTMAKCDERSGLQDGFTAKLLHPNSPGGRQCQWPTVQLLVDALYPNGVKVTITPVENKMPTRAAIERGKCPPRASMYILTPEQASKMGHLRAAKLTTDEKRIIGLRGAIKRWDRVRAERKNMAK